MPSGLKRIFNNKPNIIIMFHQTNLKFREKLTPRTQTKYIVIHHTAVKGDKQPVNEIHQWHLDRKCDPPMAGIGYHYYIRKNGEIYQGRPRDTKGAHVKVKGKTYNSDSIGVCFEGDFRTEKMGEKQMEAAVLLLSILSLGYGGAELTLHKKLDTSKDCPGKNFPVKALFNRVHAQKQRFIQLHGSPKEVDYSFLLKYLG